MYRYCSLLAGLFVKLLHDIENMYTIWKICSIARAKIALQYLDSPANINEDYTKTNIKHNRRIY
jgi:hypothetical protein